MEIKKLTGLFVFGVAGVVVCLVMTIVTAVQEHHQKELPPTHSLAVPAISR